jgi:hypothetical protein
MPIKSDSFFERPDIGNSLEIMPGTRMSDQDARSLQERRRKRQESPESNPLDVQPKIVGYESTGQPNQIRAIYADAGAQVVAPYMESMQTPVSTEERSRFVREHPLGGGEEEQKIRSLNSVGELEAYTQTPAGLQLFGGITGEGAPSMRRQAGEAVLGQIQPRLLEEYRTKLSEEKRTEGGMAYFYKTKIDPRTTLSVGEQAAEIRKRPELLSQFNALTPEERTQDIQGTILDQVKKRGEEISKMTTKEEYDRYQQTLVTSGIFGSFIEAKVGGEQILKVSNPALYQTIQDDKLLTAYEPLTAEARNVRVPIGKDDAGYLTYATAGELEQMARRDLIATKKMTGQGREGEMLKADARLGEIYDYVGQRLKQASAVSKFGLAKELVDMARRDEVPAFRKKAREVLLKELGPGNLGFAFNDDVQSATVIPSDVLAGTDIVNEETAGLKGGAVRSSLSNPEIARLIISDMKETLAKNQDGAPGDMSSIMTDSMRKVLKGKSFGITVFGKRAGEENPGEEFVKDLEWSVKYEFDDQAKKAFGDYDKTVSKRLLPVIGKFLDQAPIVSRWNESNAKFALSQINGAMQDSRFRIQYDFDKSGAIDKPEELATAYMVLQGGQDAQQLAFKLSGNSLGEITGSENAQQIFSAFSELGSKLQGAMLAEQNATAVKTEEELGKLSSDFPQVLRMPRVNMTQENMAQKEYRATGIVPDSEWVSSANPKANSVEIEGQKYFAKNPIMAQVLRDAFGSTLDRDTKNVLLNVINPQNGYLGGGLPADKLRIITGAISDRDDALVDMGNENDKVFFQTMNADISAETERAVPPEKVSLTGKPGQVFMYTKGGANADRISVAPIRTAINSDPQLSLLWRTGIDSRNPRWSKMAYQLAREKVRNEISTDVRDNINSKLNTYLAGLQDALGVGLEFNPDTQRDKLMQAIAKKYSAPVTGEVNMVNVSNYAVARDIVDNIGRLSKDLKTRRDEYLRLGLKETSGNQKAIDDTLKWMESISARVAPASVGVPGTQQNVVSTAVIGNQ